MRETFKDIEGYESLYRISDIGSVLRVGRISYRKNGRELPLKEKLLNININKHGYCFISLQNGNKRSNKLVHRLVLETFDPIDEKLTVNHINGIKTDNRLSNLEWATVRENIVHSFTLGTRKLNNKKVGKYVDGKLVESYDSLKDAADKNGVSRASISLSCSRAAKKRYRKPYYQKL